MKLIKEVFKEVKNKHFKVKNYLQQGLQNRSFIVLCIFPFTMVQFLCLIWLWKAIEMQITPVLPIFKDSLKGGRCQF